MNASAQKQALILGVPWRIDVKDNYMKDRTNMMSRCQKCQGSLRLETAIDLVSGIRILQYVCFNCGRRWHEEKEPRPLSAA